MQDKTLTSFVFYLLFFGLESKGDLAWYQPVCELVVNSGQGSGKKCENF